jgi:alpha-L-arabinofuranosidase
MKKNQKLGKKKKLFLFVSLFSLAVYSLPPTAVFGATATISVDYSNDLAAISPYIYGHNSSNWYCNETLTVPEVKQALTGVIKMIRWPSGACIQRFDFKYNNYQGRMFDPWAVNWDTVYCPSIEDELQFCYDIGAEPLIGVNVSFCGPAGTTDTDYTDHGNDFQSYTGYPGSDTPQTRAQYGADMVTYIRSLCDSKGWPYPKYYNIGNEWMCDGQSESVYITHFNAYYAAIKAVDPDARLLPGIATSSNIDNIGDKCYALDNHPYNCYSDADYGQRYTPGTLFDGSFSAQTLDNNGHGGNLVQSFKYAYTQAFPTLGEPLITAGEWMDHWDSSKMEMNNYNGAIYSAHMLHRGIKNKIFIMAPLSIQSNWTEALSLFSPTYMEFKPRPRYYLYKIYQNFGDRLLECYDPDEYTPGVTDYFTQYKDEYDDLIVIASRRNSDGNLAIMATNLSRTDSYNTTINIANFTMGGEVVAYTMNQANCYEGGPGPSSQVLTGKSSPVSYTFEPYSVTCLLVKGISDGPIISNVTAGNLTRTGATITWDTDEPATTRVEYGPTINYGSSTTEDSSLVTSHSVSLTDLSGEYNYRVISKDADQKENMSVNYIFTTLIDPAAKVTLEADKTSLPADNQTTTLITGSLRNLQNQIDKTITSGTFSFSEIRGTCRNRARRI